MLLLTLAPDPCFCSSDPDSPHLTPLLAAATDHIEAEGMEGGVEGGGLGMEGVSETNLQGWWSSPFSSHSIVIIRFSNQNLYYFIQSFGNVKNCLLNAVFTISFL